MFKFKQWSVELLEMSLKVKERAQKYWVVVSDLLCRALTQECCTMLKGNRPLPMKCRTRLYIAGVLLGILLFLLLLPLLLLLLYLPFFGGNNVLQSAIVVLILTFPSVTINWFIKNRDVSQQQNETLFSNSLQLLFKENDKIANSVGLKELVKLKREGRIDPDRVDIITSSGLQIEKASLQKANLQEVDLEAANLQGAKLQGANIQRANLQGVELQGAYLQGANLEKADLQWTYLQGADLERADLQDAKFENSLYDEETQFPDGFNPEQHGMELIKK